VSRNLAGLYSTAVMCKFRDEGKEEGHTVRQISWNGEDTPFVKTHPDKAFVPAADDLSNADCQIGERLGVHGE
jgi:hypothetical protein